MSHYYFNNTPHGKLKTGQKLDTKLHYDYISREGKYENIRGEKETLAFKSYGNLPKWADSPSNFWQAAEENRNPNGRAYREFKFALQEELTLEENIECIEKFIAKVGIKDNHVYCYTIHDKPATFDEEHRNIHCHLMFSEKILEKDRPLGPERFFKNYATDKSGEAVGGYRSNRAFQGRNDMYDLREIYADIFNEQLEKNHANLINHKSLKEQRADLLAENKIEEAALLDREPQPHLGKAYRNPKTVEKILTKVQEVDEEADSVVGSEDGASCSNGIVDNLNTDDKTKTDYTIELFAIDAAMRKMVKEIQKQRAKERLYKLSSEQVAKQEAEYNAKEINYVTASDITKYCDEKIKELETLNKQQLQSYNDMKKLISDKYIERLAKEEFFGERFTNDTRMYQQIVKEIKVIEAQENTLKDKDIVKYLEAKKHKEDLLIKKVRVGKRLAGYKTVGNNPKYQEILAQYEVKAQTTKAAVNSCYVEYKKTQAMLNQYNEVKKQVAKIEPNVVLYTDDVKNLVSENHRLYGKTKLKDFEVKVHNKDIYFVVKQEDDNTLLAVKLNDKLKRGKAPVYILKTSNNKVVDLVETNKKVAMYRTENQKNEEGISVQNPAKTRNNFRAIKAQKAVESFCKKLINNQTEGKLNLRWYDDEKQKSELKQVEQKAYENWL